MESNIRLKHRDITGAILHAFYKRVYAKLGYGFLEKVYENALAYELEKSGLAVVQQQKIEVFYAGQVVGEYFADLVVSDKVLVEIKAAEQLNQRHEAQLLNYLRSTQYEVGLLLNFGPKAAHTRKAFDNKRKNPTWKK
ncbi:GxxExxY protein [Candidatus Leptofilum sp.]|uniref:GxxExxY protein n=1 Tax=Candidatus Leptofilum sp. TaxID=3241576 RepID=UPI003B59BAF2